MSSNGEPPDEVCPEEGTETSSVERRHYLTNDLAALVLAGVVSGLMLLDVTPYYEASQTLETAFVAAFGVAVVWMFGKGAARVIFGDRRQ